MTDTEWILELPKESIVKYELEVKADEFQLLARGTADLVEKARTVLGTTGPSELTARAA